MLFASGTHKEPEDVIKDGDEDASYKPSEVVVCDLLEVQEHIDGDSADCQLLRMIRKFRMELTFKKSARLLKRVRIVTRV